MVDINSALEATVRIGTPLLLAGLGETILERSGVINIGIEGVMLSGAFGGFCAAWGCGSPWAGACVGMLCGGLLMLIFALIVLRFRADQIVTGMAIYLVALGITSTIFLRMSRKGALQAPTFGPVLRAWREVPVLGPLLFAQSPMTWAAIGLIAALWYYLERSERGLELRAVGENPAAAEASGVSVIACRWKACFAAGLLGGLGGAFLTISQTASFDSKCTSGRGFVALAAVVLGRYSPIGTALACLFFGAAFYARDAFPSGQIQTDVVEMLPYVLTLVVLCLKSQSMAAPAALGKPYTR